LFITDKVSEVVLQIIQWSMLRITVIYMTLHLKYYYIVKTVSIF